MKSISVVAPFYNEAENLTEFIEKTQSILNKLDYTFEIVLINDNSNDASIEIVNKCIKTNNYNNIKIVNNRKNKGITFSLRKGIECSNGDIIIFLPTDMESDPSEDIPKLLNKFLEGYDIVCGVRDKRGINIYKHIASKIFNFTISLLFKAQFKDLGWIKIFHKDFYYELIPLRSNWHRYLILLAHLEGFKISQINTNYYKRNKNESKFKGMALKRVPGAIIDFIVIIFLSFFNNNPMHIFLGVGSIFITIGSFLGMYLLYYKFVLLNPLAQRLPLLFTFTTLLLFGLQLIIFGFLAELIVNTKEQMIMYYKKNDDK